MAITPDYEKLYPLIRWREPLRVGTFDNAMSGLACRLCIAQFGLVAWDILNLPQTREEFDRHMEEKHVVSNVSNNSENGPQSHKSSTL